MFTDSFGSNVRLRNCSVHCSTTTAFYCRSLLARPQRHNSLPGSNRVDAMHILGRLCQYPSPPEPRCPPYQTTPIFTLTSLLHQTRLRSFRFAHVPPVRPSGLQGLSRSNALRHVHVRPHGQQTRVRDIGHLRGRGSDLSVFLPVGVLSLRATWDP